MIIKSFLKYIKAPNCIYLLILCCFYNSHADFAYGAPSLEGYMINTITILRSNVFDLANPEERGLLAKTANKLKIMTRENTIRNELLFKEGDIYDHLIIEEAERNLRKLKYFTDIFIQVIPDHEELSVDIVVHTKEQWTLIIGGTFGGADDKPKKGLDIGDINFLGTGQNIKYGFISDNDGLSQTIGFNDTTLLDTRYNLDVFYNTNKFEKSYSATIEKPFYSLKTESSHGISYSHLSHNADDIVFRSTRSKLFYGWKRDFWDDDILRNKAIISLGSKDIEGRNIVTDNKFLLSFDLLFNPYHFEKETYIEKFRDIEDIALGQTLFISFGWRSPMIGSSSSDFSGEFSGYKTTKLRLRDYMRYEFAMRVNDDNFNNKFYEARVKYYFRDFGWNELVFNTKASYLQSDTNKLSLGGTEGLRGYKTNEFEGNGRIILNLEDRIYTFKPFFYRIIEPGFVIFTDWGGLWNSGDKKNSKIHGSVGTGLRIALLKAPGISLVRIDVGFPVTRSSSPVITMGMEGFF